MTTVSTRRFAPERVSGPEQINGEAPGGRLLASKLALPQTVFPMLTRTRLSRLLELTTQHRITLVSAPAGSGKTTACASWAQGRLYTTRIAWLSLDHGDNDPVRFRSYLLAALRRAEPALNEAALNGGAARHRVRPGRRLPVAVD